ncbi:hypothetical protein Pla163_08450 [Planctomycetes bacterium Pla163]|uniref:HEAT repeat protein n=1 Tax=Rohdeia mirabilis TaxID=2528008 RepID=A0A518CWZ8_9BACT|nr:hypothetical protein Pla163_08450 [Planctomycetes bacterium Pla163]
MDGPTLLESFKLDDDTKATITKCIRRKDFEWSEAFFLSILEAPRTKMEVYWTVLALRDCGTAASVPALKELLYFPKQDVKACSVLTIALIAGASESKLYGDLLLDPKYSEKGYAMWAIAAVADHRAIDAVVAYFRKNTGKIRRGELCSGAVGDGIEFLGRYISGRPDVLMLLQDIWSNRHKLPPADVARLEAVSGLPRT